jgi:hypothetical protein
MLLAASIFRFLDYLKNEENKLLKNAGTYTPKYTASYHRSEFSSHKVKVKVVPVYTLKAYRRRRGIAPLILNLSARWRCVVNIMARPLPYLHPFPPPPPHWGRTPVPIE